MDSYDSKQKNIEDKSKYESLKDLEQSYFIIDDILDNYRQSNLVQIYSTEHTKKIDDMLIYLKDIEDFGWIQNIIFSLPV